MLAAVPSKYAGESFPAGAVEAAAGAARAGTGGGAGWLQTTLSLLVVLGLVLALAWLYKKLTGQATGGNVRQVARVLGRSAVSPRHGVVLLKVGRRVLVCGESAGHPLTTLDTITDSDEVAELEGGLNKPSSPAAFLTSLGQARAQQEIYPPAEDAEVPAAMAREERHDDELAETQDSIADLMRKVENVTGQLKGNR